MILETVLDPVVIVTIIGCLINFAMLMKKESIKITNNDRVLWCDEMMKICEELSKSNTYDECMHVVNKIKVRINPLGKLSYNSINEDSHIWDLIEAFSSKKIDIEIFRKDMIDLIAVMIDIKKNNEKEFFIKKEKKIFSIFYISTCLIAFICNNFQFNQYFLINIFILYIQILISYLSVSYASNLFFKISDKYMIKFEVIINFITYILLTYILPFTISVLFIIYLNDYLDILISRSIVCSIIFNILINLYISLKSCNKRFNYQILINKSLINIKKCKCEKILNDIVELTNSIEENINFFKVFYYNNLLKELEFYLKGSNINFSKKIYKKYKLNYFSKKKYKETFLEVTNELVILSESIKN